MLAFMGMAPLGSLLGGLLARWLGTPQAVLIGGGVCFLAGVLYLPQLAPRRNPASPGHS